VDKLCGKGGEEECERGAEDGVREVGVGVETCQVFSVNLLMMSESKKAATVELENRRMEQVTQTTLLLLLLSLVVFELNK